MAAGLPGRCGPDGGARNVAHSRGIVRSRLPKRLIFKRFTFDRSDFDRFDFDRFDFDRFDFASFDLPRAAMPSGTAVSTEKQSEIAFEGTDSSCYPLPSLGAEGIAPSTSRSPN
jgi:hypothetical protein